MRDAGHTTTGQVAPGEKRGAVNNGDFKTVVALSDHDEATHSDAGPSSPFISSSHLPSPGVRWLRYRTVTVFCYMASAVSNKKRNTHLQIPDYNCYTKKCLVLKCHNLEML